MTEYLIVVVGLSISMTEDNRVTEDHIAQYFKVCFAERSQETIKEEDGAGMIRDRLLSEFDRKNELIKVLQTLKDKTFLSVNFEIP